MAIRDCPIILIDITIKIKIVAQYFNSKKIYWKSLIMGVCILN
jgi:hypothetical protein